MTDQQISNEPEIEKTDVEELYEWNTWLHHGPSAASCEDVDEQAGTNDCSNPLHFHAWCRLPNQFLHRTIRERALAAKARRVRTLRDEDSDAAVILEEELDSLLRQGETAKPGVVDELVAKDWWRDYNEAAITVREIEGPDGNRPYEHIDADLREWGRLSRLPEEERNADDFRRLEEHITAYNVAIDEERTKAAEPRRQSLEARTITDLVEMLRDQRIDIDSNASFQHEYAVNEWLLCTLRFPEGAEAFTSREQLEKASNVIIDLLKATYEDLERSGSGSGNS